MIRLTIILLLLSFGVSAQDFPQKVVGKQRFTDSLQFSRYKNNGGGDSVLSTNTEGKVIMKKVIGTGAAVDTVYRVSGTDSIYYIIGGLTYSLKDSTGSGGSPNTSIGSAYKIAVNGTNNVKSLFGNWGAILDSATSGQVGILVDTSAGKVATQTMLSAFVPSLVATRLGYGDGSNLMTSSSTLNFVVGTGKLTTPKLVVNSNTDGGGSTDAAVIIQRTIDEPNGTHGFRDKTFILGDVTGTASFDAEATINGDGASDEMVGFQSRHIIDKASGTLATAWAFLENTQLSSPATNVIGFESRPYIYAGGSIVNRIGLMIQDYEGSVDLAANQYGITFNPLTKATGDNYGLYDNGSNKHYLHDLRVASKLYVGGNAAADSTLDVVNGIWGKRGVRFSGLVQTALDTTNYKIAAVDASTGNMVKMYWPTGGAGETNTASNLGGGLDNYSTKVGVDLRFNSFAAADFDLGSNLISIDATLKSNWNDAYTDRLKWDGGATGLTAATGRSSLGGTTVGQNIFTLTNPGAITFLRMNADNTVDARSAANYKTDLSLNNVENTALSTWAGTANILTVGTIGTGTWQGTVIGSTYGGTGINNAGRTLTISTNSGTLAFGAASKTLTINNSIGLTGTDGTTMTFPATSANVHTNQAANAEKVVTVTDGAGAVIDASLGNWFTWTAAADRTAGTTTNPVVGQKIIIFFTASGANRTLTLPTATTGDFAFGTDITGLTVTTSGKTDMIGATYGYPVANRWSVAAYVKGF